VAKDKKKATGQPGGAPSQKPLRRAIKDGEYDNVLQHTGEFARDMHGHKSDREAVDNAQADLEKLAQKQESSGKEELANVLKAGAKRLHKDWVKRQK
jgi:hypothetical protein